MSKSQIDEPEIPQTVDRAEFHAELGTLRVREKAHTQESDAIAAADGRGKLRHAACRRAWGCDAAKRVRGTGRKGGEKASIACAPMGVPSHNGLA
ncbi:hypothetical protein [Phyllobacterium zundukense]|uniref:hypothetical protein n=1 Tax=Phyllobacterium zundukense TaxID=1867719 RepID=UPI00396597D7